MRHRSTEERLVHVNARCPGDIYNVSRLRAGGLQFRVSVADELHKYKQNEKCVVSEVPARGTQRPGPRSQMFFRREQPKRRLMARLAWLRG